MKLWRLIHQTAPHYPIEVVVRAATPERARAIAAQCAKFVYATGEVWLHPSVTDCTELCADGEEGLLYEEEISW